MKAIASNGMEIQTGEAVLVRNSKNGIWVYCNFSHVNKIREHKYVTSYAACKYCIPYKENENLVGTARDFSIPKYPYYTFEKVEKKFRFGAKVKAYNATDACNNNKIGILIDQDKDDPYYKYKVAFPINNNTEGNTDWFSEIEYLD